MKPEMQFRLFSIAILALAALALFQDPARNVGQENAAQALETQQVSDARIEAETIKEIELINKSARVEPSRFALEKY